jgi:hypothetical protein
MGREKGERGDWKEIKRNVTRVERGRDGRLETREGG